MFSNDAEGQARILCCYTIENILVTGAQIAETDPDGKDTQLSKFYLTVC